MPRFVVAIKLVEDRETPFGITALGPGGELLEQLVQAHALLLGQSTQVPAGSARWRADRPCTEHELPASDVPHDRSGGGHSDHLRAQ